MNVPSLQPGLCSSTSSPIVLTAFDRHSGFLVSVDSVRRIPRACLDIVEASASGEVRGNPGENFSIDGAILRGSAGVSGIDMTESTGSWVVTSRRVEEGSSAFERFPLGECFPRVFSCHVLTGFDERDGVGVVCVELVSVLVDLFDGI